MKRRLAILLATVVGSALLVQLPAWSSDGAKVLEFDTMAPVDGPFVGTANPIRGINGGGLPWQIDEAKGELTVDGRLEVDVEGLVLLEAPPVPPALQGTNPIPSFRAIVSCLTEADGSVVTTNVVTDPFPATADGDSKIEATVSLPSPCVAPIVFVGPSGTAWFAATGQA
jgi:hypothetical protein